MADVEDLKYTHYKKKEPEFWPQKHLSFEKVGTEL